MICGPASSFCLLPSIESLLQIPHNVLMSYLTYNICRTIFIGNQAGGRDISKDIAAMAKEVRVASISRYGKSTDSSHCNKAEKITRTTFTRLVFFCFCQKYMILSNDSFLPLICGLYRPPLRIRRGRSALHRSCDRRG